MKRTQLQVDIDPNQLKQLKLIAVTKGITLRELVVSTLDRVWSEQRIGPYIIKGKK